MSSAIEIMIRCAIVLADEMAARTIFLFLDEGEDCRAFGELPAAREGRVVVVVPRSLQDDPLVPGAPGIAVIRSWSGNQSRFSRIKYAFLQGVYQGLITTEDTVVCVLGPRGRRHLDTITVHDLARSWSEDYPFDPRSLATGGSFTTIMAALDIALDIGALGREGKAVGTCFVIGDDEAVMRHSHQAVFNPFHGYEPAETAINRPEVAESMKELAKLDGAFVVTADGTVLAAGRHLDARSHLSEQYKGFGSRHRAAAGITAMTGAAAIVVSESSGRVTIFEGGAIIASLEPVISRRLE